MNSLIIVVVVIVAILFIPVIVVVNKFNRMLVKIEEADSEEFEVNVSSGELVFYENVLGNLTGSSLNWTMDGKDYYIISDNLTNEELLKVASSTSAVALTK